MGVWIEIHEDMAKQIGVVVAPFVGVWIEIGKDYTKAQKEFVAPFVGVWWECGLKFKNISIFISVICRSLRGSVD